MSAHIPCVPVNVRSELGGMHNLSAGGEVEVEVGRGRIWGPPQTGQGAEKKLNQIRTTGPGELSSLSAHYFSAALRLYPTSTSTYDS